MNNNNAAPEWRKALKNGDRVLVVRVDDDTPVMGGTVRRTEKSAMVRLDLPADKAGHLLRCNWLSCERKELWDEERKRLTWMKLTNAL